MARAQMVSAGDSEAAVDVRGCRRGLEHASERPGPSQRLLQGDTTPVLLTYLNRVPKQWLLGRSAAQHGLPFAVTGIGRRFDFADKLFSARRAIRLIHRLNPRAPVIFADGMDTLVVNRLSAATRQRLERAALEDRVILGAECFSYPVCYREHYLNHTAHQQCRVSGSPTCYVNSGLYAGSSAALMRLLAKAHEAAVSGTEIERGDDQAAMHKLILRGALAMEVDSASAVFLNMHPCRGHNFKAPPMGKTSKGQITMCFYEQHDPLARVSRRGGELWYRGGQLPKRSPHGPPAPPLGASVGDQRPLLMHANGFHTRLAEAYFGRAAPTWGHCLRGDGPGVYLPNFAVRLALARHVQRQHPRGRDSTQSAAGCARSADAARAFPAALLEAGTKGKLGDACRQRVSTSLAVHVYT